jgi:hypothetical protein
VGVIRVAGLCHVQTAGGQSGVAFEIFKKPTQPTNPTTCIIPVYLLEPMGVSFVWLNVRLMTWGIFG